MTLEEIREEAFRRWPQIIHRDEGYYDTGNLFLANRTDFEAGAMWVLHQLEARKEN